MPFKIKLNHIFPIFLIIFISILCAASAEAKRKDCFYPIHRALERGGYHYGLDCRVTTVNSLRRLGRMTRGRRSYTVYDLSYSFLANPGGAIHNDRRLLFFDRNGKYLGQPSYIFMGDDSIHMRKSVIHINESEYSPRRIALTEHGLPPKCPPPGPTVDYTKLCMYK
jgi:hypothetical protein